MTHFTAPRFSPWQIAALAVAKRGGTVADVATEIRVSYPEYTPGQALNAARTAVQTLTRKRVLQQADGRLALVTEDPV